MNSSNHQKHSIRTTSLLLLLIWVGLGLGIRLLNLDLKSAASIEISTIGYSLGHGFKQIPLDLVINLDTLLAPLRLDTAIGYSEVFQRLREESTHPPLYFWLTRWWAGIWLKNGDLVSLQVARSLSAVFGTLAIPSIFGLGWMAFRSRLVAHLAAILMAFSPYGVYLAQEARHYTLTVLWVIASLACLVEALKLIRQHRNVPLWLSLVWIVVNGLGIATHYFFVLTLSAEAIALVIFWLVIPNPQAVRYLRSLSWAGFGTLATALVWLPIARSVAGNEMTTWIATNYELSDVLLPIPRLFAWIITMVMLLPIERVVKTVVIGSGVIVLGILIWAMPILVQQWRRAIANSPTRLPMVILTGYLCGSLIVFLLLIYGLGKDASLAARYHFGYFPALILIVAVALANCRLNTTFNTITPNKVVTVILMMSFLGSLTVVSDFGFRKSLHADALAVYIQQTSQAPILVAITHRTHSEIRELVALAYSFKRLDLPPSATPQFMLVSDNQYGREQISSNVKHLVARQSQPLNLIGVNLDLDENILPELGCKQDNTKDLSGSGYRDRFYFCN
ncbi:hypothetical protein C7B62_21360 [Pleurocapsa sp. CCALA 161]|uniref:glycosyltransferase family 39 protein n=1 Tax=Pleurocapsa sp. CCALA 161 TaxID=2107688 RepID=UPI000D06D2E3|nr:hypothetical protein [Pleurocapsa sp. CCALA 161]PSB06968.1 hypothetical protein C7B62_21360 [Pleurocapsa sp. CCALA 161]